MREAIIRISRGNPGALRVLVDLSVLLGPAFAAVVRTLEARGISGSGIWILYKDRCGQDYERLSEILLHPPHDLAQLADDSYRPEPAAAAK